MRRATGLGGGRAGSRGTGRRQGDRRASAQADVRRGRSPCYGMKVNFAEPLGAESQGQKFGALRGRAFALTTR